MAWVFIFIPIGYYYHSHSCRYRNTIGLLNLTSIVPTFPMQQACQLHHTGGPHLWRADDSVPAQTQKRGKIEN